MARPGCRPARDPGAGRAQRGGAADRAGGARTGGRPGRPGSSRSSGPTTRPPRRRTTPGTPRRALADPAAAPPVLSGSAGGLTGPGHRSLFGTTGTVPAAGPDRRRAGPAGGRRPDRGRARRPGSARASSPPTAATSSPRPSRPGFCDRTAISSGPGRGCARRSPASVRRSGWTAPSAPSWPRGTSAWARSRRCAAATSVSIPRPGCGCSCARRPRTDWLLLGTPSAWRVGAGRVPVVVRGRPRRCWRFAPAYPPRPTRSPLRLKVLDGPAVEVLAAAHVPWLDRRRRTGPLDL